MRARNVPRNFGSRPAFFSHIDDSAATSSSRRRLLRVVDRKWYHVFTRINESWCSEHFIPLWRRRLRALSDGRSAELARGGVGPESRILAYSYFVLLLKTPTGPYRSFPVTAFRCIINDYTGLTPLLACEYLTVLYTCNYAGRRCDISGKNPLIGSCDEKYPFSIFDRKTIPIGGGENGGGENGNSRFLFAPNVTPPACVE